jgi:integrase/recombinase XerC
MDRTKRRSLFWKKPYAMIRCRAAAAGIETKIGNHTFRATGVTGYLKNGGALETAAAMAKVSVAI